MKTKYRNLAIFFSFFYPLLATDNLQNHFFPIFKILNFANNKNMGPPPPPPAEIGRYQQMVCEMVL
jgi:hypothetical protein